MAQSDNYLNIGTVLNGRYRIESPLASGGFGKTYLVKHLNLGKQYALKEFYIKDACLRGDDDKMVTVAVSENHELFDSQKAKFLKEARVLSELSDEQDSHIIRVTDLFEENGTAYYVMDYVRGESLGDRLERSGSPMSEAFVLDVLGQMLKALDVVHGAHLLHMDIKPANIMVDDKGKCTLIDFGASKQYSLEDKHTLSSIVPYTLRFAPLEQQSQDYGNWGPWTDFYALGATLFNLLTSKMPPMANQLTDDSESALAMPGVSDKTAQLIRMMMSLSIRKRPHSVEAIRRYLQPAPISTPVPTPVPTSSPSPTPVPSPAPNPFPGPTPMPAPTPSPKPIPVSSSKPNKKAILWFVGVLAFLFVLGLIAVLAKGCDEKQSKEEVASPVEDTDVTETETKDDKADSDKESDVEVTSDGDNCTFTIKGVTFDMVKVEEGTFQMGSYYGDSDEQPVHEVTLSSYMIGKTEVTQELWEAIMGNNPSTYEGAKRPVANVSWDDIVYEFLPKLKSLTGYEFRLPTEAEWEYAARGGGKSLGYTYSGSYSIDDVAWYTVNCHDKGSDSPDYGMHPVKTKAPNELGIYDMSGNVWEWCKDVYSHYNSYSETDPENLGKGDDRVCRGGSWYEDAYECRPTNRAFRASDYTILDIGFRLAL